MWTDLLHRSATGAAVAKQAADGRAAVLELADRMRRRGGGSPATLYGACVAAFSSGAVEFDEVTPLYRHACLHARIVVPRDRTRLCVCPVCEAELDDGA